MVRERMRRGEWTPEPYEREFPFAAEEGRKWRFDFAWSHHRVAVEIEGAVWIKGRHTQGGGFQKDAEKYNVAAILGWRVIRLTDWFLRNKRIDEWVERVIWLLQATKVEARFADVKFTDRPAI